MGLESATFISELVNTNPIGTDDRSTADDHMRLIKAVLQSTFPNATAAINPTPTEFNILDGAVVTTAELNRLQSYVGTANRALISDGSGNIIVSPGVTTTELNLLDGLLASTSELNTMNGITATTAELNRTTALTGAVSRVAVTNGSGNLTESLVTTTELNKLDGLTASTAELNLTDGLVSTTAELNRLQSFVGTASRAVVTDGSGNLVVSGVTITELNLLDGLVSSTAELNRLQSYVGTASRALISNGSGNIIVAPNVTSAELDFINSVTSNVQTQINGKAASAHSHTGAEISDLAAGDTTTGTFNIARIPTIDTSNIASSAVGRSQIANSTTTSAGSWPTLTNQFITLNNWALFPMIHHDNSTTLFMKGHNTDGSSASNPRFGFRNSSGGSVSFDIDHRWIISA